MDSLHAAARALQQTGGNNTLTYFCPQQDTSENDAGFQYWYQNMSGFQGNDADPFAVCTVEANCAWLQSWGSEGEQIAANAFQWIAFSTCIIALSFYAYHSWKATTGWEEVYVAVVELIKVCLELTHQYDSPATLYLVTGNYVMWIRYAEWLLTCPVILIHLSNITGLAESYNKRTMMLLVSDLGTVVMGITSAACYAWPKWIFFFLGLCYGCNTYFHAAKVYVESYHMVPKGICRTLVRAMSYCFFVAWTMFPLLFVFGPTGFKITSRYGDEIGHQIADIISKQIWGMLGHYLRVKIHEHIIIHGNITKPTKVKVAGVEIETEEMVDHDDPEGVNQGTKQLANRESFLIMRNRLKEQGVDVRASFDESNVAANQAAIEVAAAATKAAAMAATMEPMMGSLQAGRVILAVPDTGMVEFFRQQFATLPAPIELVPALGLENAIALVQQAMQMGGLDCVLTHPEFLRDRSATGLVNRVHGAGQRVVAFGWSQVGPMRDMIESSGADAWLEGPSFGTGLNQQQLVATLVRAQQARRQQMQQQQMMMMGGMGGMGMGGVSGGGMMPQANAMGSMTAAAGMMPMGGGGSMMHMGGGGGAVQMSQMSQMQQQQQQQQQMQQMQPGQAQSAMLMGNNNPLFNQPAQASPGSVTPTRPVGAAAAPAGGASEAEMLQQLMAEINRLKGELGEH